MSNRSNITHAPTADLSKRTTARRQDFTLCHPFGAYAAGKKRTFLVGESVTCERCLAAGA